MKKLICKLHHEWGQSVNVGGVIYVIGKDTGEVVVDDAHAVTMLANTGKWDDAATAKKPAAGRRTLTFAEANPGVPNFELRDPRTGRILNDDEALKALSPDTGSGEPGASGKRAFASSDPITAQADALRSQAAPTNVVNAKPVEAVIEAAVEPKAAAEPTWPAVSEDSTKPELIAVLKRLKKAGQAVDVSDKATKTKGKILDQIEIAYAALAKG